MQIAKLISVVSETTMSPIVWALIIGLNKYRKCGLHMENTGNLAKSSAKLACGDNREQFVVMQTNRYKSSPIGSTFSLTFMKLTEDIVKLM